MRTRTWQRTLLAAPVLIGLLVALAIASTPSRATHTSGTSNLWVSQQPSYKGWVTVKAAGWTHISAYPIARPDERVFADVSAWTWSGTAWRSTPVPHNTRVYAWPWGSGWSWAWTSAAGWRAIRSDRLLIREMADDCTVSAFGCPIR